jgi:hypothetical protein
MTQGLLDQVDFVIDALSTSTNPDNIKECRDAVMGLQIAREVAVFGATELPELQPGERRLTFNQFKDLSAFIKTGEFTRLLDTNDLRTQLGLDGKFYVDVVAKSDVGVQSLESGSCEQ